MYNRRRLASHSTFESTRLKKPLAKRNRLTETIQNSTSGYLKFLVVWLIVIAIDLALDFRLEFLLPCWMFLRRLFESFKYKNCMQAFVLMGCTFCSDYFVYAFIPSSWIFFLASTYVWTQHLFTPDRSVGLPALLIWMLFLYVESCVRPVQCPDHWSKVMGSNCIGYPIVMLGFGFKSCMTLHWMDRCKQLISYKNDFFYRLVSTHAESQNLYHAPIRAFRRTNLLKLRYKMRYSGASYQAVEDIPIGEETSKSIRMNGHLSSMNSPSETYTEVVPGSCIDDVSPLTGRSWNYSSMRTFLGHTVDPNEDFWTFEEESDGSSIEQPTIAPAPPPPQQTALPKAKEVSGAKRSNNILSKMFDFREKPSVKVAPVETPVKEARVLPIKKEKPVEEAPLKQPSNRSERKSKKGGGKKGSEGGGNSVDDMSHTAMKIHLDKLKDIDDDLYFVLQNHLDSCQNALRDEKRARLRAEMLSETMEESLKKSQSDLHSQRSHERSKEDKLQNLIHTNKSLQSELDKQRSEMDKMVSEKASQKEQQSRVSQHDRGVTCELIPKEANHSKCVDGQRKQEQMISELRRSIERSCKERDSLKSQQKTDGETAQKLAFEIEELRKQNGLLNSRHDSMVRSLRAETKIKMDLFSALGDARRQTEELSHKFELKSKEHELLKQRFAEAMAVSTFPTSSFVTSTTASDTFYSANGF